MPGIAVQANLPSDGSPTGFTRQHRPECGREPTRVCALAATLGSFERYVSTGPHAMGTISASVNYSEYEK